MADKNEQWADALSAEHGGWLTGFLAEEDKISRRMLWRMGSWGVAAVGSVVIAVLASQSQIQLRRDQFAANDMLNRQAQQIQFVAKETQTEAKRLSLAIETLNGDRDRLYTRLTSVEQGLDSVTGSIKRQASPSAAATPSPPKPVAPAVAASVPTAPVIAESSPAATTPAPASSAQPPLLLAPPTTKELPGIPATPVIAPVVSTAPSVTDTQSTKTPTATSSAPPASAPLIAWKSMMAPPDAASAKLAEVTPPTPSAAAEPAPAAPETTASVQPVTTEPVIEPVTPAAEVVAIPVARTEFGVDIGGANSVDGLRAIWRGMSKSKAMTGLRPIMTVKERSAGLGMQLRLVAGPFNDAAEAAKTCAVLATGNRPCETTVFEGQRLTVRAEPAADATPTPARPAPRKRAAPKPPEQHTEQAPPKPAEEPAPPPKPQSSLSSFFGSR